MGYDGNIVRRAQSLVKRCGTRDPFEIAEHLGVEILTVGSLKQLKGFYRVIKRNRFIFLNEKNSPQMNRIVCAHELGHDQLHREFAASNTLQEFMLYDMNSIQEYEANVFAANLLLEDDAVLELIYDGYNIVQIAAELQSDMNLVALKVDYLIRKGHDLRWQEYFAKFLK